MKSFLNTGRSTAFRTATKSSSEPPKRRRSVRTLIAVAPPFSYREAKSAGSDIGARDPLLGEDLFTSAMSESSEVRNAEMSDLTAGATSTASNICAFESRRDSRSSLTPSMIESRTLMMKVCP